MKRIAIVFICCMMLFVMSAHALVIEEEMNTFDEKEWTEIVEVYQNGDFTYQVPEDFCVTGLKKRNTYDHLTFLSRRSKNKHAAQIQLFVYDEPFEGDVDIVDTITQSLYVWPDAQTKVLPPFDMENMGKQFKKQTMLFSTAEHAPLLIETDEDKIKKEKIKKPQASPYGFVYESPTYSFEKMKTIVNVSYAFDVNGYGVIAMFEAFIDCDQMNEKIVAFEESLTSIDIVKQDE